VKFAEVSRSATDALGVNLGIADGVMFNGSNIGQVSPFGITTGPGGNPMLAVPTPSAAVTQFGRAVIGNTAFDYFVTALRQNNLLRILAEPNLVATSGQEASFLAGGEFPIPVSQASGNGNAITIDYKQYGVGLAFTPVVLSDGRISMRVRPEVSQLSSSGAVSFGGYSVPALTTRRAETTVELGSGQSFMIAGLIQNSATNNINKAPFLGDLPILGALFRSTNFRRDETELVVVVTPYLTRPVSGQMAAPADGYRSPSDVERDIGGQSFMGVSGKVTPTAIAAPTVSAGGGSAAPGFKM